MVKTYYVTTAIDYPNAKPHMGHAYEKIVADFLARWHRLAGFEVFFLTGTDEHGQKIEKAAKNANKTPQKFVDEMVQYFTKLCKQLNISNDDFIRTTDKKHCKTATELFTKVQEKGLIYKGKYSGLYCTGCERFYLPKELENGLCPDHKKQPDQLSEESYFFKMSQFQNRLINHINKNPMFIQPGFRRKEILNRLKEPLRDLSLSRTTFKWGVQVPADKKHVIYVWFDALLNYLSGISYPTRKFDKFWPANTQVIGKDILWFHSVIWPTILMAIDLDLPKTILAHGHVTNGGVKMSKSLGNVVDPIKMINLYGTAALRYTLLRDVPAGQDGDFSERGLVARNNGDLADSLGNLLQRTSVLIHKYFDGQIPICGKIGKNEIELNNLIPNIKELQCNVDNYEWNQVIEKIWTYIKRCNKYINDCEPWKLKDDKDRLSNVLYTLVEHLRMIAILIHPIIPSSAQKLCDQIGQPLGKFKDLKFKENTTGIILKPKILFAKLEIKKQEADPFSKICLKVGKIIKVSHHPNADKLFILDIDAGEEKRQIVTGLRDFYKSEELEGKNIVFVSNLKSAKFRGEKSEGMVLSAELGKTVKVLEAKNAKPGDLVTVKGVIPTPTIIKIDEFFKVELLTKLHHVLYNNKELATSSGPIEVVIADGAKIK